MSQKTNRTRALLKTSGAVAYSTHPLPYHIHMHSLNRDFWWNSVGFVFLTCYHFWWLAPVNLYTGVNVATMSVPPDSLVMFGKYYRPLWGVTCGVLQVCRVVVHFSRLIYVETRWPLCLTASFRTTVAGSSSTIDALKQVEFVFVSC